MPADGRVRVDGLSRAGEATITYGDPDDAARLAALQAALRETLDALVAEVAERARHQEATLAQEGLVSRGLIYTGALLSGLYGALEDTVETVRDLGAAGVQALVCLERLKGAALEALRTGDASRLREPMEAIYDGVEVAQETAQQVYDALLVLLMEDPAMREMLTGFAERYLEAHSSVEKTEMVSGLAFDIVAALVAAAVTGGAGAAAVAMSKSRHFAKAADKLREIIQVLKRLRLSRTRRGRTDAVHVERARPLPRAPVTLRGSSLSGWHNRDWHRTGAEDFRKPKKLPRTEDGKIDTEVLSRDLQDAYDALDDARWAEEQIAQDLESGRSFEVTTLKAGERLYGLGSHDYAKGANSKYWLTEDQYAAVRERFRHPDGRWDRHGVKEYLALPCFNRADALYETQVAEDMPVLQSWVAESRETTLYYAREGADPERVQSFTEGGGPQTIPTRIGNVTEITGVLEPWASPTCNTASTTWR